MASLLLFRDFSPSASSPIQSQPTSHAYHVVSNLAVRALFRQQAARQGIRRPSLVRMVHNIDSKESFSKAIGENKLSVVDFFATWCGPCKVIAPQVVKMSEEYTDAAFYKVDVDELSDVAAEVGIRAMPTFVLFKNGQKVKEVVGANPAALKQAIQENYRM